MQLYFLYVVNILYITGSEISGLVFDWISNLLGWIEAQSNIISYSVNSGSIDSIYTNLQPVDSLTIDSHNRLVTRFKKSRFHGHMSVYKYHGKVVIHVATFYVIISHGTSCGSYNVFNPSVSQSVLFFISATSLKPLHRIS